MCGRRGGKGEVATVQASSLVGSARKYDCVCWFGGGEEGADVAVAVGLGEDDCGESVTIAGTRMISSCSNVVASITCNNDVCCPGPRISSLFNGK